MMLSVNRLALIALTAGLLVLGPSGVAAAETTVSGERDTNAPLVIDPSSDPTDPLTTSLSYMPGLPQLIRIQRMPVTKTIQQVTIGDLSRGDTCTSNPKLQLYVHEFASGNFMQGNQLSYSTVHPEVGPQPSKITWTLPPTTLRAGRAYSFRVQYRDEPPGCTDLNQTTWAHNEPQVEGGPVACNGSLQFAADSSGYGPRFWHVHGQADEPAGTLCDTSDFDPVLPTGWLVVRPDGNLQRGSRTPEYDADPQYNVCRDTSPINPVDHGALETYSNSVPNTQLHTWVCRWPQFAAPGDETSDGWYYAVPWRQQRDGEPRDMYLKLDTIDYDALLQLHGPHLIFDRDDNYRADSAAVHADSPWTVLFNSYGTATGPPWLDDLDATYYGTGTAADSDLLDRYPSGVDAAREQYGYMRTSHPGFYNRTYGRATADADGNVVLQYWLFYFHQEPIDGGPTLTFGEHQGDWELVTVRLDSESLTPDRAFYAQHGSNGQSCAWGHVGHSFTSYNPDVYVAQTTHASYFSTGVLGHPRPDTFPQDIADGDGDTLLPGVTVITNEEPGWVSWPGRWGGSEPDPDGSTAQSPPGPAFQTQWEDHDDWAANLDDACD